MDVVTKHLPNTHHGFIGAARIIRNEEGLGAVVLRAGLCNQINSHFYSVGTLSYIDSAFPRILYWGRVSSWTRYLSWAAL